MSENCAYCELTTDGQHAFGCPNRSANPISGFVGCENCLALQQQMADLQAQLAILRKPDCYKCGHAKREDNKWYCTLTAKSIDRKRSKDECVNFSSK